MLKKVTLALTIILLCIWTKSFAEGPNMLDGEWEMTVHTEMAGMPGGFTTTIPLCLTSKEPVPQMEKEQKCRMINQSISDDTITWTMECSDSGVVINSDGRVTYRGNTMEGVVNTTINQAGEIIKAVQRLEGKRIGPCK